MKRIKLTQGQFTLVDTDLYPLLSTLKWMAHWHPRTKSYYVHHNIRRNGLFRTEALHHYVAGYPLNKCMIDHKNGNTLDNRRSNLRVVTSRENAQNRKMHRAGRLVGTSYHIRNKKWQANIQINGKIHFLGYFKSDKEAHERYIKALEGL